MFSSNLNIFLSSKTSIEEELRLQCAYTPQTPRECAKNSGFCYFDHQSCDGVANCPNGEDEALENCSHVFPEMATFDCLKKDRYNVNITIKSVPCDGIYECLDDEDEKNCSLPDYVLICIIVIVFIISFCLAYCMWSSTISTLCPITMKPPLSVEDLELLHGTEALKSTMFQAHQYSNPQAMYSSLITLEMEKHNQVLSEVVCCIKVNSAKFEYTCTIFTIFRIPWTRQQYQKS